LSQVQDLDLSEEQINQSLDIVERLPDNILQAPQKVPKKA
jgi:hypothetical protein